MGEKVEDIVKEIENRFRHLLYYDNSLVKLKQKKVVVYGEEYNLMLTDEQLKKVIDAIVFGTARVAVKAVEGKNVYIRLLRVKKTPIEELKKIAKVGKVTVKEVFVINRYEEIDELTGEVLKTWEESEGTKVRYEDDQGNIIDDRDKVLELLNLKVIDYKEFSRPVLMDPRSNCLEAIYVFNDGMITEYWGETTVKEEGADAAIFEVPIYKFRNNTEIYRVFGEWPYTRAIKLFHKKLVEEWIRQREEWRKELEEAWKEQKRIEEFLLSKEGSKITAEELEWLKSISPSRNSRYYYFDGINDIYVLDLFDKVEIKVRDKTFKVPKS